MRIGIVVHGPNIIDSDCALQIINILSNFGKVNCILGGTMGRTAVIDASLENTIDISTKRLPSESVKLFKRKNVDVIFLLNYGKSQLTGHTFGFKVFKNSFLDNTDNLNCYKKFIDDVDGFGACNKKSIDDITFIQIERPGEEDGSVIKWNGDSSALTAKIAKILNLRELKPEAIVKEFFYGELIQSIDKSTDDLKTEDSFEKKVRNIYGVSPDENIFVNGIVIGKSNSENLAIVSQNSYITDIIGGKLKTHGVRKLGKVDIDKAIVKTGLLRKSNPSPRIIAKNENIDSIAINGIGYGENHDESDFGNSLKIAFVDHAAYNIYDLQNVDLVVTVGDDTTLVASDILYRFNIPVIGVTDGDLDKVVEKGFKTRGSMIIELNEGLDDVVGKSIFKTIFANNNLIEVDLKSEIAGFVEDDFAVLKNEAIENFKNRVLEIVNNITLEYKIKK